MCRESQPATYDFVVCVLVEVQCFRPVQCTLCCQLGCCKLITSLCYNAAVKRQGEKVASFANLTVQVASFANLTVPQYAAMT